LRSLHGGWGRGREPRGSTRAAGTPSAGGAGAWRPPPSREGRREEEEEEEEEEEKEVDEEEGGRAWSWRSAPPSSPLWEPEKEEERRTTGVRRVFLTGGWRVKLCIYWFVRILMRSQSKPILAEREQVEVGR
jgi:hypothetical protein